MPKLESDRAATQIELVVVTPEMKAAGLERARELVGEDPGYIVSAVYLAMEYERLFMNGQLSGLDKQALKGFSRTFKTLSRLIEGI